MPKALGKPFDSSAKTCSKENWETGKKPQYNLDNTGIQINIRKSKHLSYHSHLSHIHAELRLKFRC